MTGELRVGDVATAAGVHVETIRYYERRGLLARPERSPGGHRLYPVEAVTELRVIKAAQRLGFTLAEIADLIETGAHHHRGPIAGLQARAAAKLGEVDQKIADLLVIRDTLQQALDAGCDNVVACSGSECCPLPFAELVTSQAASMS